MTVAIELLSWWPGNSQQKRPADYEVTDPETGQRHTVTATPFQKEAGYHALVQMMRIAMKS